jgi:ribosome-associated toxin RatA of RatAB toxin-antitoxin module
MPEVAKSVLVPYTPEQMFMLVDDVQRYPEFLPWCSNVDVAMRDEHLTRATLHINYRGIKQQFTTANAKEAPQTMHMRLVDGPFRSLDGAWRFNELNGRGCKIEFNLRYEFSSRVLAALVGPVFSYIADTMVEAFVKRAERIYAAR